MSRKRKSSELGAHVRKYQQAEIAAGRDPTAVPFAADPGDKGFYHVRENSKGMAIRRHEFVLGDKRAHGLVGPPIWERHVVAEVTHRPSECEPEVSVRVYQSGDSGYADEVRCPHKRTRYWSNLFAKWDYDNYRYVLLADCPKCRRFRTCRIVNVLKAEGYLDGKWQPPDTRSPMFHVK